MVILRLIIIDNTLQESAMLTLKNVSKSYHPKKGKVVQALKDVSLSFTETGMVFLLGKSGSGKSTLMNIIGGLDNTDQGEVIFLNKQVSSFNQSEYDAYRNTQVGFVFQEFNLIESFSVYQNIALSKRLQNQEVTREEVVNLLETLDLKDEIDRMPYELSGGQKQRISIGRALIKNPKILLADEPTGALDSDTSKQIFELLKSLSKSRLVIIVSHDRDFAQAYGDRVIELSDGKVIKDSNPIEPISSNQTMDLKPPHLPLRDAFKIGLSAFLKKPVRMVITMLILIFSFTLFAGIHSVSNYNIETVAVKQAYKSNEEVLVIGRTRTNPWYDRMEYINLNQEMFDSLSARYPNRFMRPIYKYRYNLFTVAITSSYSPYYSIAASGIIVIDDDLLTHTNFTLQGRLPQNSSEVVLPLHLVETYQKYGYIGDGVVEITNPDEMIGKFLDWDYSMQVVGIIDTHFNNSRYAPLREIDNLNSSLVEEISLINEVSPHTSMFVSPSWVEEYIPETNYTQFVYSNLAFYQGTRGNIEDMRAGHKKMFSSFRMVQSSSEIPSFVMLKPGIDITNLSGNQIIVNKNELKNYEIADIVDFENKTRQEYHRLIDIFADENYEMNKVSLEQLDEIYTKEKLIQAIKDMKWMMTFDRSYSLILYEEAEINVKMNYVFESTELVRLNLGLYNNFWGSIENEFDVEIVGFVDNSNNLVSPELYSEISNTLGVYPYSGVLIDLTGNQNRDIEFIKQIQSLDTRFELMNEINNMMAYNDQMMIFIQDKLYWFGVVLALFTGSLFQNYIHLSITHKKKDIGILRALGGRKKDIFTIFLTEAVFMGTVVSIISLILTVIFIHQLDAFAGKSIRLDVSFLWVEFRQVFWVFTLAISVATLSSWLPIHRYSKQKPVDVIKVIES